ncbi:MAG: CRISPR-associated endonuclease Cas1 [Candidatus Competibacteraceae bacterium]|nr:CRISPR-associated endonuclease Cas1 [Candidatus Competibacteraceae bacterium]
MLVGAGHGDARRRLGQYRLALDAGARLVLARRLIAAKLRAQIRLLDAALERRPDARKPLHDALDTLRRLARVISQGPVDWHCEALLGCAEAGVPVVFLRGDGAVRAYAFGGRRLGRDPHDLLYTRLRARLARPGGMARYGVARRHDAGGVAGVAPAVGRCVDRLSGGHRRWGLPRSGAASPERRSALQSNAGCTVCWRG